MRGKPEPRTDFAMLAQPAQRALAGAGIERLEELAHMTEQEVQGLHGMGPNAMAKLRDALSANGLAFAEP